MTTGKTGATSYNNEIQLTDQQNASIDAAIEKEFDNNSDFLNDLNKVLNNATLGSPSDPKNQLFAKFTELNNLVDTWLTGFPDAEREQMRLRYFNQITAKIKTKLTDKKKPYENKNKAILDEAEKVFGAITSLSQNIRNQTGVLRNPAAPAPTDDLNSFANKLAGLNKSMLIPSNATGIHLPTIGTATTIHLKKTDLVPTLRDNINTYKRELIDTYQNLVSAVPAIRFSTPPIDDEKKQDQARTQLITSINSLEAPFNNYIAALEANLTHPDTKAPIDYQTIRTGAEILERYEKQLTPPGVDHILSREERFTNVQFAPMAGTPGFYEFYHPVRTPDPDNPYRQGDKFTETDNANFYAWVHRNKSKLSPEQVEAIEANVEHWRGDVKTRLIDGNLRRLAGILAGGHIDTVKSEANNSVETYVNGLTSIPVVGVTPPTTIDRKAEALNLMAMYYKLDTASMTQAKIEAAVKEKMEQELIGRLNLPDEEEHSEALDDVRETYAEKQNPSSRAGVLGSTRARVASEMKKEFKDKDLTKPENRQEFTKTVVNKILQERLNTINATMNYKKPKWYQNIPAKLGIDSKKFLLGGGLLGASLLGAGIASGAVGSALTTAYNGVTSALTSVVGAIPGVGTLTTLAKGAGTLTAGVGGYLVGGQLMNAINYGPWSEAQRRTKQEVLGTKDASGASIGGLGTIDRATGTYAHSPVHRALAAQIAYAEKRGATLSTSQDSTLINGGPANQRSRFDTADYLWKREREGLTAIINKELNDVMLDGRVKDSDKANTAIANALQAIYAPAGIENNFLQQVAGYRKGANYKSTARVAGGIAAAIGGGALFNVIL